MFYTRAGLTQPSFTMELIPTKLLIVKMILYSIMILIPRCLTQSQLRILLPCLSVTCLYWYWLLIGKFTNIIVVCKIYPIVSNVYIKQIWLLLIHIDRMAKSYKNNFIVGAQAMYRNEYCERCFASWDFAIIREKALKNKYEANSSQLKVFISFRIILYSRDFEFHSDDWRLAFFYYRSLLKQRT